MADSEATVAPASEPSDPKAVAAEEAALAAEISTAHAEVAVERAEEDQAAAQKAADRNRPRCPHCGNRLRFEHDLGEHMHCDGSKCASCCFESGPDGPVLRPNSGPCPSL